MTRPRNALELYSNGLVGGSGVRRLDSKAVDAVGRSAYHNSDMLRDLANVMEHPIGETLWTYLRNPTERETTLFFMWMYAQLKHLDPYAKLGVMMQVIRASDVRAIMVQRFRNEMFPDRRVGVVANAVAIAELEEDTESSE